MLSREDLNNFNKKNLKIHHNIKLYFLYLYFSRSDFKRGLFMLYLGHIGFSGIQIGGLQAILFWSNLLSEIPTGILGDKYGRKVSIILGLIMFIVNGLGYLIFDFYMPFLLMFIISGIGFSFISGSDDALFYDSLKVMGREQDYVKLSGRTRALSSISLGTAILAGGFIQSLGWNWIFISYILTMVLALGAVLLMTEVPVMHEENPIDHNLDLSIDGTPFGKGIAEVEPRFLSSLKQFILMPKIFFTILSMALFEACLTPYFIFAQPLFDSHGLQPWMIGLIYGLVEYGSAIMSLLADRVASLVKLKPLMILVMLGTSLALVSNLIIGKAMAIFIFVLVMLAPDIMSVLVDNYLHKNVSSKIRASAMSVMSFFESAFIGLAYFSYGILSDKVGLTSTVALSGLLPLVGAIVVFIFIQSKDLKSEIS